MLSDTSNTPPLSSPVYCRRASSAAVIPQSIPESLPISLDNVSITERRRQNININRGKCFLKLKKLKKKIIINH